MKNRVTDYFSNPRLNCSSLKLIGKNPKWFRYREENPDAEDDEKRHNRIGSAIDCILTTPEQFNEEFAVSYKERPGGNMGIFIDALPLCLDDESDVEEYREAYDKAGYKLSIETVIKQLWALEKYRDYYLSRKNAKGKTIVSYDEYEEVLHCKEYLLGNPYTRRYFLNTNKNEKLYHQVPIYFDIMLKDLVTSDSDFYSEDMECKALLDGILINHEEKYLQPFDLKTTGRSVLGFRNAYVYFGYYLQAAFYDLAVRKSLYKNSEGKLVAAWFGVLDQLQDYDLTTYEIRPMQFVVSEKKTSMSNPARIFQCSESDILAGVLGGEYNGEYYPGFVELIEAYLYHKNTNYWDMPKKLLDNEGVVNLDIFKNHDSWKTQKLDSFYSQYSDIPLDG